MVNGIGWRQVISSWLFCPFLLNPNQDVPYHGHDDGQEGGGAQPRSQRSLPWAPRLENTRLYQGPWAASQSGWQDGQNNRSQPNIGFCNHRASRLERPDLYDLFIHSITTRGSFITPPVTPTIAMKELIVKSDLEIKVPYITPISTKITVEMALERRITD